MARSVRRTAAAGLAVVALAAAGCGNSGDDDEATPTTASDQTTAPAGDAGGGDGGDRDTFVPIEGVPGVTDDSIGYAVIGTRSGNPLGTCILDCYLDGINAYFAFRNSEGGVYGRELVVAQELDDELANNQARALEVTTGDESFGAFNATLLATGFGPLDEAGVPTYVWGIHATEMAGRQNVFGHNAALCATCSSRTVPYAVKLAGAARFASLGYGVSENSKVCTSTTADSVEMYSAEIGAEVVYVNDELEFGLPNGIAPEVTAMKDAGVDFISTCMDLNGMKTLATELQRQGMDDVTLYHPNTYNQQFVAEAGGIFDGDFISAQFMPFEAESEGTGLEDFQQWMDETGAEMSELAMVGWINADLAFQGLLAAGPEFDRQSVIDATNQLTAYDADGLIVPVDWSRQHNPPVEGDPSTDYEQECFAPVRVVDGQFETVAPPDTPWLCWPNDTLDWSEPVPTSFGD